MIITIRGTGGSGKSTLVRGLLKQGQAQPIYGLLGPKKPEAYRLALGKSQAFILGPYEAPRTAVGCDIIDGKFGGCSSIASLIRKYEPKGHVVFEGAMISATWGALGALLEEYGQKVTILFLDTSLEQCLKNIGARGKTDRRLHSVELKFRYISNLYRRLKEEGRLQVRMISVENGLGVLLELLRDGH
jgi:hypothetical protein